MMGKKHSLLPVFFKFFFSIVACYFFSIGKLHAIIPGDSVIIGGIIIEGNKVTRDEIILRELTFHQGDVIVSTYLNAVLDSSTKNLMNTFLFNFATLTPLYPFDSVHILIRIEVTERWYWWPEPIFTLVDINFNKWIKEKDFSKTTYGLIVTRKNFRGRNETVSVGVQQGFSERYSFGFRVPYINKKLKDGITIGASYLQSKQVLFKTEGSRAVYFKSGEYIRHDLNLSLLYSYRRGFYNTTAVYTGFRRAEVGDTVFTLNKDFFLTEKNSQQYFWVGTWFVDDHRDFHAYPLRGYYASIDIAKLGLANDDIDNLSIITILKAYKDLGSKFFWAGSARIRLTNRNKQSFFDQVSVGSGSTGIQGYEDYLILGQNSYVFKSALKYNLLEEKIMYLKFIPIENFNKVPLAIYFNLFADAGYMENKYYSHPGDLSNQLLHGYGAGFDFVTYYNLILRVEYSFNKFGENGFFVHFSSPI